VNQPDLDDGEVTYDEQRELNDREALELLDQVIGMLAKRKAEPEVVLRLSAMLGWMLVQHHSERVSEGVLLDAILDCQGDETLCEGIDTLLAKHDYGLAGGEIPAEEPAKE